MTTAAAVAATAALSGLWCWHCGRLHERELRGRSKHS